MTLQGIPNKWKNAAFSKMNMKKKIEMKEDGKDFERFEELLSKVVKVPKSEIDAREKAEKERKAKAKQS